MRVEQHAGADARPDGVSQSTTDPQGPATGCAHLRRWIRALYRAAARRLWRVKIEPGTPGSAHTSTAHAVAQISKNAFVACATALCAANNDQLGKAAQQVFGNQRPTTQTWRPFMLDAALPVVETRLRGLDALPAPAGDRAKLAAITNSAQAAITAAKHNPQILSPASRTPFDRFDQLVAAYGIPACAVGG